ncbi:MAG: hypothetical protein KC912_12620 [Proteobacteria bacterium]|nr:hypothetical protein [Pseudomonadota bacterium]
MNALKKTATVLAFIGFLAGGTFVPAERAQAESDDTAAILLSAALPGVGEWYNAGFSGGFPLVECILGTICPCVNLASVIDAAAGRTDDGLRFNFWASPN